MNNFLTFIIFIIFITRSVLPVCTLSPEIDPAQINYPENVCLRLIAAFKNFRQRSAIIFHGPTGTGKSLLASNMAIQNGAYLIVIKVLPLGGKNAGDAEKEIAEKIDHAIAIARAINLSSVDFNKRNSSTSEVNVIAESHKSVVIVVDEVDSIAQARTSSSQKRYATATLLSKIDEITKDPVLDSKISIIMTTNRLSDIDSRVLDRSVAIKIDLPNQDNIKNVIKFYFEKHGLSDFLTVLNLDDLAADLEGLSLRAIEQAVSEIEKRKRFGFKCDIEVIDSIFNKLKNKYQEKR